MTATIAVRRRIVGAAAGLAAILLASIPALAADRCESMVQSDLNECARADYRTADAALNAVYVQLMKKVGPKTKDALRAAQKAWLSYRDATCALETMGLEGGSAYPMELSGCLKGLTDARTKALTAYLACKPDDVNCVGAFQE